MAGNYPDVPSWRFAWDRDGSQAFNGLTQLSSGTMIATNDESVSSGAGAADFALIFPELRDLDGYWIGGTGMWSAGHLGSLTIQTSVNTTNGVDGTWVTLRTGYGVTDGHTIVQARSAITTCTVLAIKGVRFFVDNIVGDGWSAGARLLTMVHLYGEIAPTVNPNRLIIWHPTLDQHVTPAYFDWGDVPRSSSADRTFRVKNNSSTQSANSVRVAQDILSDTSPSVVGQHTLMKASVPASFLAQVNVGDLAPGAISEVVTLRRVTPSDAVLSLWCHRIFAEAATWS